MATFSTSHTCHMWRISDFSTYFMWRHLKFLHMWRNFQFPHNCDSWKAEMSQHEIFISTNDISDISDRYQVCFFHSFELKRIANPHLLSVSTSKLSFSYLPNLIFATFRNSHSRHVNYEMLQNF